MRSDFDQALIDSEQERGRGAVSDMALQTQLYEEFRALHERPGMFTMPSAWDGASAALLKRAGFKAIGTSSLAVACALGRQDCRSEVSREEALRNARLIARLTSLPVNADLEDGFGPTAEDCVASVEAAIASGLAGIEIEDTTEDPAQPLHSFDEAVKRVRAAAAAATGRIVLTARTGIFLQGELDIDEAIRRLTAFAEAGADVLYAPGLPSLDAICKVVTAVSPKPVNVVVEPADGIVPLATLANAGVKRLSLGGVLYRRALGTLEESVQALAEGHLAFTDHVLSRAEITALLSTTVDRDVCLRDGCPSPLDCPDLKDTANFR